MKEGEIRFTIDSMHHKDGLCSFFIALDDGEQYCPILVFEFQDPFRLRITTGDCPEFNTFQELLRYVVSETPKRRSQDNETSQDHS